VASDSREATAVDGIEQRWGEVMNRRTLSASMTTYAISESVINVLETARWEQYVHTYVCVCTYAKIEVSVDAFFGVLGIF